MRKARSVFPAKAPNASDREKADLKLMEQEGLVRRVTSEVYIRHYRG